MGLTVSLHLITLHIRAPVAVLLWLTFYNHKGLFAIILFFIFHVP